MVIARNGHCATVGKLAKNETNIIFQTPKWFTLYKLAAVTYQSATLGA